MMTRLLDMTTQIANQAGIIAALDQSGGTTPAALRQYGVADADYVNDEQMFDVMHKMRVRIMTSPAFSNKKIIAAILFDRTMEGEVHGKPVPSFLWEERGIVPFVKLDDGLDEMIDGAHVLKPIPDLEKRLARAVEKGVFGTKMRSIIADSNSVGIAAVVKQQFEIGRRVLESGLVPIIEPEVLVSSSTKADAEEILRDEIARELDRLPAGNRIILKLTIPTIPDYFDFFNDHGTVLRVTALSGGYDLKRACSLLARNRRMIASFSRVLTSDVRAQMDADEFDAVLQNAVDEIFSASVTKS